MAIEDPPFDSALSEGVLDVNEAASVTLDAAKPTPEEAPLSAKHASVKKAKAAPRKRSLLAPFEKMSKAAAGAATGGETPGGSGGDPAALAGVAESAAAKRKAARAALPRALVLLDSRGFQLLVAIATVVALFGPDVWVLALPPSADGALEAIMFSTLVLFLIELVLGVVYRTGYLRSFYFVLDFVAMLSLVPDIPFLFDPIMGNTASAESSDNLAILRAGRLVRTGTRTTKVLRVLKIVRMVRILRMVKLVQLFRGQLRKGTYETSSPHADAATEAPNKLGLKMADLIGKRVIAGTILMLLVVPLMEVQSINVSYEAGMDLLQTLQVAELAAAANGTTSGGHLAAVVATTADKFVAQHPNLVFAALFNETLVDRIADGTFGEFRPAFILEALVPANGAAEALGLLPSVVVYDTTADAEEQAVLNILLTVMLTLLLGSSAYFFNRDVYENVVRPIIKTTMVMRKLAKTLFLLSNESEKGAKDEDLPSMLEGDFIDSVVGQLVTFFNVEDKVDVRKNRRNSLAAVAPSAAESRFDDSALTMQEKEDLNKQVTVLDSFEDLWKDKQGVQYFKVFLTSEFAVETLLFLEDIEKYRRHWQAVSRQHWDVMGKFVDERASCQVNISDKERRALIASDGLSFAGDLYDTAFDEMYKQLQRDNFPRFKKSHLAKELREIKKKQIMGLRQADLDAMKQPSADEKAKAMLARKALGKFTVIKRLGMTKSKSQKNDLGANKESKPAALPRSSTVKKELGTGQDDD